jgi:hypothetical protein
MCSRYLLYRLPGAMPPGGAMCVGSRLGKLYETNLNEQYIQLVSNNWVVTLYLPN